MIFHLNHSLPPVHFAMLQKEAIRQGLDLIITNDVYVAATSAPQNMPQELLITIVLQNRFELIRLKNNVLVEKIKKLVADMVLCEKDNFPHHQSAYISKKMGCEFDHLSRIFSQIVKVSLTHYILLQKIERIKVYIIKDVLNFTQIAYRLNFINCGHMGKEFKKHTGFTPSEFLQMTKSEQMGIA